MAYYCLITDAVRTQKTGFRVDYAIMDDSSTPANQVDTGSMGFQFLATGTAADRRQAVRDQLIEQFQSVLDRLNAGDVDFTPIRTALVGVRYPAA